MNFIFADWLFNCNDLTQYCPRFCYSATSQHTAGDDPPSWSREQSSLSKQVRWPCHSLTVFYRNNWCVLQLFSVFLSNNTVTLPWKIDMKIIPITNTLSNIRFFFWNLGMMLGPRSKILDPALFSSDNMRP